MAATKAAKDLDAVATNGDEPEVVPQLDAAEESVAVNGEAVEAEKPTPPVEDTFTFRPSVGEAFSIPRVSKAIPKDREKWFFWKLHKLKGLEQPIFYLEQACVPDDIQERVMLLDDAEWTRFFEEWMADGTGATLGE